MGHTHVLLAIQLLVTLLLLRSAIWLLQSLLKCRTMKTSLLNSISTVLMSIAVFLFILLGMSRLDFYFTPSACAQPANVFNFFSYSRFFSFFQWDLSDCYYDDLSVSLSQRFVDATFTTSSSQRTLFATITSWLSSGSPTLDTPQDYYTASVVLPYLVSHIVGWSVGTRLSTFALLLNLVPSFWYFSTPSLSERISLPEERSDFHPAFVGPIDIEKERKGALFNAIVKTWEPFQTPCPNTRLNHFALSSAFPIQFYFIAHPSVTFVEQAPYGRPSIYHTDCQTEECCQVSTALDHLATSILGLPSHRFFILDAANASIYAFDEMNSVQRADHIYLFARGAWLQNAVHCYVPLKSGGVRDACILFGGHRKRSSPQQLSIVAPFTLSFSFEGATGTLRLVLPSKRAVTCNGLRTFLFLQLANDEIGERALVERVEKAMSWLIVCGESDATRRSALALVRLYQVRWQRIGIIANKWLSDIQHNSCSVVNPELTVEWFQLIDDLWQTGPARSDPTEESKLQKHRTIHVALLWSYGWKLTVLFLQTGAAVKKVYALLYPHMRLLLIMSYKGLPFLIKGRYITFIARCARWLTSQAATLLTRGASYYFLHVTWSTQLVYCVGEGIGISRHLVRRQAHPKKMWPNGTSHTMWIVQHCWTNLMWIIGLLGLRALLSFPFLHLLYPLYTAALNGFFPLTSAVKIARALLPSSTSSYLRFSSILFLLSFRMVCCLILLVAESYFSRVLFFLVIEAARVSAAALLLCCCFLALRGRGVTSPTQR